MNLSLSSKAAFVALALFVGSQAVQAQENLVLKEEVKRAETKKIGWTPAAKVGVNASFANSSNVVGKTDGSSETYGLDLSGSYNHASDVSEWRNTMSYTGTTTKNPVLPRYVKSNDLLKFESLYLHSFQDIPKLGPYVSFHASAPIFFGEDVRPTSTTYSVHHLDQTVQSVSGDTFKLTDSLKPLTTRESAGLFWKAFNDGNVQIEVRLGAGAEQTAAAGQYAVTGTAADGSVTVNELKNLSQLGAETGFKAKGKIDEKTGWELSFETLTPVVSNKDASDDRDPIRLTNIDGAAKLSSNITSWAAISYDYKLTIKPQLVDRTQQSHMLVFNLNYNLF
jgi:hypothetical protein